MKNRKDLQSYYLRADLFLFPSVFDTSGLVAIEAAAHKLPTLAILGACAAENIIDEKNGFLAENNVASYSQKLEKIINNKTILKSTGEEAFKSVYKSWDMVCKEVLSTYEQVIQDFKKKAN